MFHKASAMAGLICAMLLLSACGDGLSELEGTWEQKDEESPVVLEITGDGEITSNANGTVCTGRVKLLDDVYKFTVDCGLGKDTGTLTLSDDGRTLIADGASDNDPLTLVRADS